MIDAQTLIQILWTGVASASYAVLFASAFSLVLKVVKVWNFAQAGLMGIAFYTMAAVLVNGGLPEYVALPVGIAATILAALAMEVYGLRVFRRRHSPSLTYFIFTLVVSEFVQNLLAMIFGTEPISLAKTMVSPPMIIGGIVVTRWDIGAIATTIVLLAVLFLLLKRSRTGKFMQAVADNPALSRLYGINVNRVYAITFALASTLIAVGMFLFGTRASMVPATPLEMMLFAVIAALLGGMGNVIGASVAAAFLALLKAFSILVIPSAWQGVILYVLLFVTILFFPRGVVFARRPRKLAAAR